MTTKSRNMTLFSVIFLLFIPFLLTAQVSQDESVDENYLRFRSEFEKEFEISGSQYEDIPSNKRSVFSLTDLPGWVFELPESNDSIIYVIGVSDPGMNRDTALLLAALRAKAIFALVHGSYISGVTDYYTKNRKTESHELNSAKLQDINKISNTITFNNSDFNIEKQIFTDNNEAFVLASLRLKTSLTDDTTYLECLAELSTSKYKTGDKYSEVYRMEIMTGEKNGLEKSSRYFYYIVKKHNKKFKVLSEYSGLPVIADRTKLKYNSCKSGKISNDTLLSTSLHSGFWYAYSSLILQKMVLDFNDIEVKHSGLNEQHQGTFQDINRSAVKKEVFMNISGFNIIQNKLFLLTNINTPK